MKLNRSIKGPVGALIAAAAIVAGIIGYGQAVDTAGDHVSPQEAAQMRAEGVDLFIQALTWWPRCGAATTQPSTRVESLRNAHQAGIPIAGYILVDSHSTGRQAVDRAREGMPPELWDALEWVAIDFEIPGECFATGTRIDVQVIYDATAYLRELGKCVVWTDNVCKSVLYTSCGEWKSRLVPPNPPAPPDTVLWNASWDNDADVDYERCPFGGYTIDDVLIEQYNGGSNVAGVWVDKNTLILREPPVATPTPGPIITPPNLCSAGFYTREQALWAVVALAYEHGLLAFGGDDPAMHPFDISVVADLLCSTGSE